MKHLLTGAAMVAALAISAPAWAQPANPSGGNSMGMPGPSPGGPGLTPYSSGQSQARPAARPADGHRRRGGTAILDVRAADVRHQFGDARRVAGTRARARTARWRAITQRVAARVRN